MTDLVAVGGPLAGAVIGAGAALVSNLVNSRAQERRDKQNAARQFQQQELREIREAYGSLLVVTDAYREVIRQSIFTFGAETEEQKNQRLATLLEEVLKPVTNSLTRLFFDEASREVVDLFHKTREAFIEYRLSLVLPPDPERPARLKDASDKVNSSVEKLQELARKRVSELNGP